MIISNKLRHVADRCMELIDNHLRETKTDALDFYKALVRLIEMKINIIEGNDPQRNR